ncbi:MAG: hypothetical protein H7175_09550, partial [Burkholderiales bacterium]|nr:hypothetical protein [Anaerolineae bacterium]
MAANSSASLANSATEIGQSESSIAIRRVIAWVIDKIGVLLILGFMILPIFWVTLTAFKPLNTVYSTELLIIPTLNNFRVIFGPAQPIQL